MESTTASSIRMERRTNRLCKQRAPNQFMAVTARLRLSFRHVREYNSFAFFFLAVICITLTTTLLLAYAIKCTGGCYEQLGMVLRSSELSVNKYSISERRPRITYGRCTEGCWGGKGGHNYIILCLDTYIFYHWFVLRRSGLPY